VRIIVLGGCGAWPEAGGACSGFLVEHDGFRLVVDLGYATLPRLLEHVAADQVDAVVISHGHPDHCADLNPLLRARALDDHPPDPLPVHAPPGALDAVLALDRPEMLAGAYEISDVPDRIGPFGVRTRLLPHWLPNVGLRIEADGQAFAYTGDCGPGDGVIDLARDVDLLTAEATYLDPVPEDSRSYLTSARQAAEQARRAAARRLLLTHLWPGTDRARARAEAATEYDGRIDVATSGLVVDLATPR
jgi:ribonuclease BN (tRNA processing enzyme)